MIKTNDADQLTLKDLKAQKENEASVKLMEQAAILADVLYPGKLDEYKKKYKAVWFLVIDTDGEIEKMAVMKPINRHILSLASTKLEDDGLYSFLESCMRECWLEGDTELLDDDEYFIPAAMKFNKMLEGKKAAFVKY